MITIPLELGDVIRVGRFKNKKMTVKEIGVDEYGLPTVNGRGIMKIRIEKLMPEKQPKTENKMLKPNKDKLDYLISKAIQESKFDSRAVQFKYDMIGKYAGINPNAVKKFVEDNNLDVLQLTMDVGQGKGETRLDLVTAILGNPNNPIQKKIIKTYQNKNEIRESLHSTDTQVKINQKDKLWWICQKETDECLNAVGFDSKEAAEHSALTKGYSFETEKPKLSEPEKPSKHEPTKYEKPKEIDLGKEKELKLEILRIARRVIREEIKKKIQ